MSHRHKLPPRLPKNPDAIKALKQDLDELDRPSFSRLKPDIQEMLMVRLLYDENHHLEMLDPANRNHMKMLMAACYYIVRRDPEFAAVRKTMAARVAFGEALGQMVKSKVHKQDAIHDRLTKQFGATVAHMALHMADAMQLWLSSNHVHQTVNNLPRDTVRDQLVEFLQGDAHRLKKLGERADCLPKRFWEQCQHARQTGYER